MWSLELSLCSKRVGQKNYQFMQIHLMGSPVQLACSMIEYTYKKRLDILRGYKKNRYEIVAEALGECQLVPIWVRPAQLIEMHLLE